MQPFCNLSTPLSKFKNRCNRREFINKHPKYHLRKPTFLIEPNHILTRCLPSSHFALFSSYQFEPIFIPIKPLGNYSVGTKNFFKLGNGPRFNLVYAISCVSVQLCWLVLITFLYSTVTSTT